MCKSIAEGGKRCRCADPEKQEKRRAAAAKRQAEYMRKKRAEHAAATVDIVDAAPETSPEAEQAETAAPDPENPFTDFTSEPALTAEQRDAERERLADFFERKLADPNATWNAAPVSDVDENPFKDWVTGQPIPER